MSYTQFKSLDKVIEKFSLHEQNTVLFPNSSVQTPTLGWQKHWDMSWKAKWLILAKNRAPSLLFFLFCWNYGAIIDVDKKEGLNGESDFVLGTREQSYFLQVPIFCVVEAKDNDMKLGLPQWVAQMVGVQYFNDKKQQQLPAVYGCVTTGRDWLFLRLQQKTLVIDDTIYSIENLPRLLGVLEDIVQQFIS